jgi:serine protease 16
MALRFALAAALSSVALAALPLKYQAREREMAKMRASFQATAERTGVAAPPDQFFQNKADHFDVTGSDTYPQRFWTSTQNWSPGGPVFLYVEGEGAGSPYDVTGGEHVELAAQYGALVIALEHRFYGASIPTPDITTQSLRLLSNHQAIGDVAFFITQYLVPTYKLDLSVQKIVTFGGSYPGALSAWLRLRLPHLISVAFSTSSPVEAVLDMVSYNAVVNASLGKVSIGGSDACVEATRAAFTVMDAAFLAGGAAKDAMAYKLNSCTNLTGTNDTMWAASNYGGAVQGLVQYNDEQGAYDVRAYCTTMTDSSNAPIDNLAAAMLKLNGPSCVDNSYADFVALAGNTKANPGAGGLGLRQWLWQTCSQFGYYQTCEDRSVCPLSLYMTLDSNTQQCADLYGPTFDGALAGDRIAFTNSALGGQSISASRIIFINGNVDPWHSLSLFSNTSGPMPSVLIDGTAHCRNMGDSSPSDPPALKAARVQIGAYLAAYMAD